METLRVTLDEADFRELVAGRVVTCVGADGQTVEIVLSGVDWRARLDAILTARNTPPTIN